MQARKLSLAEAHPSQVVKVEVDAVSQSAAFLLRDSSCLLFPSLSGPSLLIPPSCTDICFLRLRQRSNTHVSSSSSSDKSTELTSRSDIRKLANVKSKISMVAPERTGDPLSRVASVDDVTAGSISDALLFLAVKPAKRGVCTDLMAWRCYDSEFFQTSILLEGFLDARSSASVARLDGVPHGISAGIAASVNVVVVHSPVVGKLWILSAKYSKGELCPTKSDRIEPEHIHVPTNAVKGAPTLVKDFDEKERHGCLQLFKCAVLDSNGPIYTIHLSLQHLLVGQLGGVRVWILRPLIKGSAVAGKDTKATHHLGRCAGAKQERNKVLEDQHCGKTIIDTHTSSNGHHTSAFDGIPVVQTSRVLGHVMGVPKNGFQESNVLRCNGTKFVSTNGLGGTEGNILSKKHSCGCSGKLSDEVFPSSNGCSKQDMGSDILKDLASNAAKLVQLDEAIIPPSRHGTSCESDTEEIKSQQKLSQFSMFSSSSDSSSSVLLPHSTCERSASCQSSCSSLSSVVGASGRSDAYHKGEAGKGAQAGVFVSLEKDQTSVSTARIHARLEQVISMHCLSEKDFVILDSHGKLHLLTLQYVARGGATRLNRASHVILNASMQPLACEIKVKYLTSLPDFRSNQRNSGSASRILWVSDGCYTVYIVAVRTGESSKEASGKTHLMYKNNLRVIGTVFLTERALLLSALHENGIMVLTEGSMVTYSSTGA